MKRIAIVFLLSLALVLPASGCTSKDAGGSGSKSGGENRSDTNSAAIARGGGVSWDQMVRNARVHDTDGDLTDHENAYTPGSLHW